MTEEERLIKEQWDKLPPDLQQEINTTPWKAFVQEVGKANMLNSDELATLERETMFVLYGFENPVDFIGNITKEVGISEDKATTVAEAIAEKIFEPISQKVGNTDNNLPMVEEGEKVHDVPHVESKDAPKPGGQTQPKPKIETPLPDYRYPDGKDPYREPLA